MSDNTQLETTQLYCYREYACDYLTVEETEALKQQTRAGFFEEHLSSIVHLPVDEWPKIREETQYQIEDHICRFVVSADIETALLRSK